MELHTDLFAGQWCGLASGERAFGIFVSVIDILRDHISIPYIKVSKIPSRFIRVDAASKVKRDGEETRAPDIRG
jgi:hypothetical protein